MLVVLGTVLFALGLMISIAWHELGHYVTARRFGVRVPEFMVGFGPTVFSRKVGETEFGVKLIPLGGFIKMIGMIPPAGGEGIGRSRRSGPMQGMVDELREEANRDYRPGDEQRQFWTRAPWKRIVVMTAGPLMNLILAVALFALTLMVIGSPRSTTTVAQVAQCAVPSIAAPDGRCPPDAPASPAFAAGIRPGDRIVSFDGRPYEQWSDVVLAIRASEGPRPAVVDRAGEQVPVTVDVIRTQVDRLDGEGTELAGFVGLTPEQVYVRSTPDEFVGTLGSIIGRAAQGVTELPSKVPGLLGAVFLGEERSQDSPVSIVGVSVLGGQVLNQDFALVSRIAIMLQLLAGVNLSLFLLNLLPILPLDGGHIFPAIWESAKKRIARMRGRPDPGPVDLARLMPVAYAMVFVILAYGGLVIVADIINPVALPF